MKIKCPDCGNVFDPLQAEHEAVAHEILTILEGLGKDARLVKEYAGCFSVSRDTRMADKKWLRLLSEMAKLLGRGEFTFNRRKYKADSKTILEAMKNVCNRELTGLKNHNYLKQTIITQIERQTKEREEELRYPHRQPGNENVGAGFKPAQKEHDEESLAYGKDELKKLTEDIGELPESRKLTAEEKDERREKLKGKIPPQAGRKRR